MFEDRVQAGMALAEKLLRYKNTDAVVLALPRGGVVVGKAVAAALGLPLDIAVARKVGHPTNPEYAICAVNEQGTLLCNEAETRLLNQEWLKEAIRKETQEAARRVATYRGNRAPEKITGRVILLVDDGIATGLTMRLAIAALKAQRPHRLVVAIPVAPSDVAAALRREVDELIVLEPPEEFLGAVGAHYRDFPQVEDKEVIRLLSGNV